jgi:TonB family protein
LPAAPQAGLPVSAAATRKPAQSGAATSISALHEVIPDVSPGARRTIRGHIKVWVRVMVNQDGSVSAVVADRAGPSKYFERIAIEAAEKWTFPPVDTPSRRLMQVRFDFSRDGTTERTVALH